MLPQTVQIEIPKSLVDRAQLKSAEETRELVAFLLERYAQRREKNDRVREYEGYYASRSKEEELEEAELLEDFAHADAEASGNSTQ
jgi:hypothetical protein